MRLKRVCRWDSTARLFRVCRLTWDRGVVGDGKGTSNKLSLGLRPRLLGWRREWDGWILTVLGVRIHRKTSWGGRFAD